MSDSLYFLLIVTFLSQHDYILLNVVTILYDYDSITIIIFLKPLNK